ncbi:MAG: hypothetical protein JXR64_02545, partial [Spirochaetales bacterium]|nr:hypothetical protein [Spirochaetales bacterium]
MVDIRTIGDIISDGLAGSGDRTVFVDSDGRLKVGYVSNEMINNYYCTSWSEVKSAITDINTNYNGGNIYMSGDIIVDASISLDLTNINFFGFNCNWKFLNNDFEGDGSIAKTITMTVGSPTFYNIRFSGSGNGSQSQTFSTYSSRKIFNINSGIFSVVFDSCTFSDIVGGTGSNPVIDVLSVNGYTGCKISFTNCTVSSHNNSIAFDMNGFAISRIDTVDIRDSLQISVNNQQKSFYSLGLNNTDLAYSLTLNNEATVFITDSSAWVKSQNNGLNLNSITIPNQETVIADDDLIMFSDISNFGNIKSIQKGNLASAIISETVTGLTYTPATGVLSLTSGYVIPTTTQETNWNTAYTNRIKSLTITGNSGA